MAHYALLDENNIVVEIIVGQDEDGTVDWEQEYSTIYGLNCKRTSYNTHGNEHSDGKEPFRKNYAAIGYIYDENADGFYEQQPYPSWTLNQDTFLWEPPIPEPSDPAYLYAWDEDNQEWYIKRAAV